MYVKTKELGLAGGGGGGLYVNPLLKLLIMQNISCVLATEHEESAPMSPAHSGGSDINLSGSHNAQQRTPIGTLNQPQQHLSHYSHLQQMAPVSSHTQVHNRTVSDIRNYIAHDMHTHGEPPPGPTAPALENNSVSPGPGLHVLGNSNVAAPPDHIHVQTGLLQRAPPHPMHSDQPAHPQLSDVQGSEIQTQQPSGPTTSIATHGHIQPAGVYWFMSAGHYQQPNQ